MQKYYPSISIVIPTYKSEKVLPICLQGIKNQNYPADGYEVLVVNNGSLDNTAKISKRYGIKVIEVSGKAPQTCVQRNAGERAAKNEYVMYLDHDMELSPNLLKDFASAVSETRGLVDAWYVPEKILASTSLFSKVRTFERSFYDGTIVDAARIIKKSTIKKYNLQYDTNLSNGPADWDLDIQLKRNRCSFSIIHECIYHHEEHLSFWKYVGRKHMYADGINFYIDKWKSRDMKVFKSTVSKQFGFGYRLFGVFVEDGKWNKVLSNPFLFVLVMTMKVLMFSIYVVKATILKHVL